MSVFKNAIEPVSVALAFTAGAVVNRRRQCTRGEENAYIHTPLLNNTAFHSKFTSWLLVSFPFLIEIWYWLLTYWFYQLAHAYSAYIIRDNESVHSLARSHALSILAQERRLGIDVERQLQGYILHSLLRLTPILAKIYYSHIIVGIVFIVYTYSFLPPRLFEQIRPTIAVDNFLAFIAITAWRCMPPRLLPPELGFVDVLHHGPQSAGRKTASNLP